MLSEAGAHGDHFAMTPQLGTGETYEVEVTLEPGTYEYACHIPGHLEAGMKGNIRVTG